MLEVINLRTGASPAGWLRRPPRSGRPLTDVDLVVGPGEAVVVLGANGAGKSTLLRTIAGLVRPDSGSIHFNDLRLDRMNPAAIVRAGVALVPERRHAFGALSVLDNLRAGAITRGGRFSPASGSGSSSGGRGNARADVDWVLDLFPGLRAQAYRPAGTLPVGEQQVLALGRALASRPRLLLVDELSAGIQPALVAQLFEVLHGLRRAGTSLLVVEQFVTPALDLAHKVYVVENGRIAIETEPGGICLSDLSWQSTHPGGGPVLPANRNKGAGA
jgi:ABC-type branched-subunit amino acid transport system ATPase component